MVYGEVLGGKEEPRAGVTGGSSEPCAGILVWEQQDSRGGSWGAGGALEGVTGRGRCAVEGRGSGWLPDSSAFGL